MTPARTPRWNVTALPPGPRMPAPEQALEWAKRPLAFMESLRRSYGDTFTLRVRPDRPWVFLADPPDVGKVLTLAPHLVRAGAGVANPLLGPLLGSRSVMLLDEPEHMIHRRFMLPSFDAERMRGYGEMMVEVARKQIARWPVGEPFALWPRMQVLSAEVVLRATFGSAEGSHMDHLRALLRRLTDWCNDSSRLTQLATFGSPVLSRDGQFREVIGPVEEALLEEVRRRRAAPPSSENEGILSMLEQAHDTDGTPMTDQELRDELITLLSDGPTATSLAWTFERLLRHPDKYLRLREEVLADDGDESYIDAVVKEILRLCPAVPILMRELVEPIELAHFKLPAGTIVAPAIYLVHHRADIYPDPYDFMPERFLAQENEGVMDPYTWLPFGSGVRRCVAAQFAQLEMKRVIQTVIAHVDLSLLDSSSERSIRSSVSFAPDAGALVMATPRTDAGMNRRFSRILQSGSCTQGSASERVI